MIAPVKLRQGPGLATSGCTQPHKCLNVVAPGRTGGTALNVGSGGNGVYDNACAGGVDQPFSHVEPTMGSGNAFTNLCYSTTDIAGLPPSTCKS
jgi:hypothetical protein